MRAKKFRYARNIGAGILCAAIIFTTLFSGVAGGGLSASALSLPYIDQLVSDMTAATAPKTFNILEIVPQEGAGSIGYYVAGQEPSSGWLSTLASKTSPTARAQYMVGGGADASLFLQLENAGILGGSADYPLKKEDTYSERYPWDADLTGYTRLSLAAEEQGSFSGTMTAVTDDSGNVRASYIYEAREMSDGDTGFDYDYADISYYEYGDLAAAGAPFYFTPTFAKLQTDVYLGDEMLGAPLYVLSAGDVEPYVYSGLNWSADVGLGEETTYYYIAGNDAGEYKYASDGTTEGYYPVRNSDDAFAAVAPGTGHFARNVDESKGYTWVGSGGEFKFEAADSVPDDFLIIYKEVYYKGGYSNNNWLLANVFNMDAAAIQKSNVIVTTVKPGEVTAARVNRADLIVLSNGFSLSGDPLAVYGAGNDLSDDMAQAIYEKASLTKKAPILVDWRVASAADSSNIKKLASYLASAAADYSAASFTALDPASWVAPADADKNFVIGNRYVYNPTPDAAPGFKAFVTTGFRTDFSGTASAKLGFEAVLKEIEYENFILKTGGSAESLPLEISMANALRYIINYSNQRTQSTKTSIKVLEVQPRNGNSKDLASIISNRWLPAEHGIRDIEIVTMSTAEFIGRIDDLNETYDMIYFGSDITGFNRLGSTTSFKDTVMNGLLYYNIGDKIVAKSHEYSGLLNSNWTSASRQYMKTGNDTKTFRYPGNDITAKMKSALTDFAAAGYPIVFESELTATIPRKISHNFSVTIAQDGEITDNAVNLKATVTPASDMPDGVTYRYQWRRSTQSDRDFSNYGDRTDTADTSVTRSGDFRTSDSSYYYYVNVTISYPNGTSTTARSNILRLRRQSGNRYSVSESSGGTSGSLTVTTASTLSANPDRVDNCTHLYEAMNSLLSRDNVLALSTGANSSYADRSSLLSYLNLSKPTINITGEPTPYANNGGNMTSMSGSSLNYKFTISNATDPTPASTTYDCKLYFDSNADGYYRAEEELSGLSIREAVSGSAVSRRNIDGNMCFELKADVEYIVSRQLPANYVGILPWKLIVTKNGAANQHIHASAHNYTRVAPAEGQKVPIKVLQILNTTRTTTVTLEGNRTYLELLDDVQDFDITFYSVLASGAKRGSNLGTGNLWTSGSSSEAVFNAIKDYDMLIIGFADGYGEIGDNVANAIFQYITLGKAVLFTHDTTSFNNYPNSDTRFTNGSGSKIRADNTWHWGYHFNTLLRDAVGLDYYGITSSFGSTLRASATTQAHVPGLTAAGYNIAYQPKSGKGTLLANTEGYNGLFLSNNRSTSYSNPYVYNETISNTRTQYITQTNEGQITTYPFDINTSAFNSNASNYYLKVAVTHKQYYQLNLNSDEIVVWYCLGGASGVNSTTANSLYTLSHNDVTNGYYIYTKGNVTYSGVGHDPGVTPDEAKLFINTMIAAYRTSSNEPEVKIKNANDVDADYIYFTSYFGDNNTVLEAEGSATDERRAVYFRFDEGTVGNKRSSVEFQYSVGTGENKEFVSMGVTDYFYANGGSPYELSANRLYKFYLPTHVIQLLGSNTTVTIKVIVTTTVTGRDGNPVGTFTGEDEATLCKIQLLELN